MRTATESGAVAEVPRRLPVALREDWAALTAPTQLPDVFDPAMVDDLPLPAQRWLRHAIAPGTPLRRAVTLRQHGRIRLGAWRRFEAVQALAPLDGFIWTVTAHLYGLPVYGFDRYSRGTGEMRHRLCDAVTVMTAGGPDIARSAAARHTSEIIWVPAAALAPQVGWRASDDNTVTLLVPCDGRIYQPTLTVSPEGVLEKVTAPRWTNTGNTPWHEEPFTALLDGETTVNGYTIPAHTIAGWGYGTDRWTTGTFIKQTIDAATYH
jgi:hypothetical protein